MRACLPALALLLALPGGAALGQGAASYGATPAPAAAAQPASSTRRYHIVTVHFDGVTGLRPTAAHPAEAFPTEPLPGGGGLLLRAPNADGGWSVRAFVFHPSQIVVQQGDPVELTFVDVHGPGFRIAVDGHPEPFILRRGEARTIPVATDRPGRVGFRSLEHAPSMAGEVLVLPRP
jgi:plastocyanin